MKDISGMDFSGSGTNQERDDQGSVLPGYAPYLSLVFKVIATTDILLLSSWVVYTIKTTRSLHKLHNIFVANLLISGMIATLIILTVHCSMIISFHLGVKPFINYCIPYKVVICGPLLVNNVSLIIIAADKVIVVTFPSLHKRIVTSCVAAAVIQGTWLIAIILTSYITIIDVDNVTNIPEYGVCIFEGNAYIAVAYISLIPVVAAGILTIIFNIQLVVKASLVYRKIETEVKPAGTDSQSAKIATMKNKLKNITRDTKPITTILVVTACSILISQLSNISLSYLHGNNSQAHQAYVFFPNIDHLACLVFQPPIYGLYILKKNPEITDEVSEEIC